jgi:2-oxoglutarate ferredoxin oxidoreductase subunit alpha
MKAITITDGSAEIVRGALAAGIDLYAGYPITPASRIYEAMIDAGVGIGCPDEITVLQTLIGASLAGKKVMTATSAPGFALMIESLGAALAMEVPLTVVFVQRMGPSSGAATTSGQGDVLASLAVSGGYRIPTLCPASLEDCARLTASAVNLSEVLRSPVIVLTEREMVSAMRTLDADDAGEAPLEPPLPVYRECYQGDAEGFRPYGNLNELQVPPFLPAGSRVAQTRYTASTHAEMGAILKATPEAVRNTARLQEKIDNHLELFPPPRTDLQEGAETLIVSYGCTDYAAREAVAELRAGGRQVSHVSLLTLFPIPVEPLRRAAEGVRRVVIPEENLAGLYRKLLCGERLFNGQDVVGVNRIGTLVSPEQIVAEVHP